MLNLVKYTFLLSIASCLLFVQGLKAQEGINGNLVTVNWLQNNLKNQSVLIIDASPSQLYTEKHIAGAMNYDIFSYGAKELPAADIEKRYQSWGISIGKKIVIYDQGGTYLATRLLFSLDYYGFPTQDIFILDGGLTKWLEAGLPVTKELPSAPNNGSFTIQKLNKDVKAELPEFLNASGDTKNNVLLEALEPNWHFGGKQFFSKPGHIPNAILLPSNDFFNTDKTFKSAEEITKMLTYYGIKREQNIYTHCGGGIAASTPYFALKFILDYPTVKLYPGSQLEWLTDQRELPFWTYDAPYLLRETNWMKAWGGKMMRMYGVSQVSIVDVRTPIAYYQGHLPYSLNIPTDVFKNNSKSLANLANILGSSGVNADHEAVVISGAGLTKEAALAFVLLEKLGQKKVSIFIDSLGKSSQSSFPITKDTTAVGTKNGATDLSIPPTIYPENFSNGVIIEDAKSTKGQYPKIFIASGKDVSAKPQDGNVVHLHYTNLLNGNGTPKAAKDIWDILTKAGVTRYGELICYSDDPGEAAVNYFILKLMGYPDIKVLIQ